MQVRRLGKASRHAAELARLAAQRAVARTAVEAEAYASYMAGVWLQEKRSDWPAALGHFMRCQYVHCSGPRCLEQPWGFEGVAAEHAECWLQPYCQHPDFKHQEVWLAKHKCPHVEQC